MELNAQYNDAAPDSFAMRIAGLQRRRMFAMFMDVFRPGPGDTVLDIGATSDQGYDHSNYFEAWYPHKRRITAAGLDDAEFLEQKFPGVRFVRANALSLPFANASFDYVHASAVIEHVGSAQSQRRFVAELVRVARRGVFITTPNRWFPVEFHTRLPLLHWLPPALFRRVLLRLGHGFLAREENLNLVTAHALRRMARDEGLGGAVVQQLPLMGWPSNLVLVIRKAL